MPPVQIDLLADDIIGQCTNEIIEKFPDLSSLSNEPADMDKFFDHEISTVGDVDAAVRGTPFASPWKNIPHFAKWRCIGFFKICKFLRKNSNDPKKFVGALRDIFSEHVGLDFDERVVNDLTRLFDESSAAKSRASPKVEKLLGFLPNIIGTHDEAERRFRDEPISVTGFVPGAATVSASNDDYIVVTQGLYIDVYRKSSGYPLVFTEPIVFGRENTISNSINDPAVAISDNGKYIAVGVPGFTDNGDLSVGRIHVYEKEFDDRWVRVFHKEDNKPGYGCRGSIDVNDHGLIAFTHGYGPGLTPDDERGYVCVLNPEKPNAPLLYTSGARAQRIVEKKYAYGDYDDDELALIKNELEGFEFQHRFGRHIKFIDSTAQDWKIRIGSGVDASDLPQIGIRRRGDLVINLGEHRKIGVTARRINDDGDIRYFWEDPGFLMGRSIVFDDSLPSSGDVTVYKGEIGREESLRTLLPVPLYYEFGDGKCIHNSAFYEWVDENLDYDWSEIDDWIRANPGMIIGEDYPSGGDVPGDYHITFIPTLEPSYGSIVLEKGNELTLSTRRSQHINDDTHPFICSDGRIVRYCDVNFDVNFDTPPDKFLMVYDDDSGTQYSTRIDQPPISVDSVGPNVTEIGYLTTKSYGGITLPPPGLESGAKTFIVLGEDEHLIGRQILFSYEKRWKLRWWILALGIVLFSAGPGGVAALVSWGLMSWLTNWNPVLEGLLSVAIFVGSTLILAAVNTGGSTLLRELLDMWIDDEKFFGKDRRTMLALDTNELVKRDTNALNMLKKFFAKGLEDFGDGVDEFAKKVKDDLEDKTDDIKDAFGKFGDGVDEFAKKVKDDLEDKTDDIKDAFGKFGDGVDEFAKKVKDDLEDKTDDIKDAFGKFGNNGKKDRTPLFKKRIEKRR
jgi:gas vesicle protein